MGWRLEDCLVRQQQWKAGKLGAAGELPGQGAVAVGAWAAFGMAGGHRKHGGGAPHRAALVVQW